MPGNDSVKINKYITFKDNDKFIRDNIYFGDIEFNTKNDATFYLSGYNNNHKVENIHIKDYYIDGKKVTIWVQWEVMKLYKES